MNPLASGLHKQVAEAAFEFLHLELVDYVKRSYGWNGTEVSGDLESIQAYVPAEVVEEVGPCLFLCSQVFAKLDTIGFAVGERLAERYLCLKAVNTRA